MLNENSPTIIQPQNINIKLKGIEHIEPYGKVENYKSCKSLFGSYTYENRETDDFIETQYDPEGYYNKISHSIENDRFQATEESDSKPEKPILKDKTIKKRKKRISDTKFKQLCNEVKRNFPKEIHGGTKFFNELSKLSKLTKNDKTGKGHTPLVVRNRYYKVFPSE